jgi:hypothetical protein
MLASDDERAKQCAVAYYGTSSATTIPIIILWTYKGK